MGKPSAGNAALPTAESIGSEEASRGTETSQYPEERKSTETPRVVASERGRAQTRCVQAATRCAAGVVGRLVPAVAGWARVTKPFDSGSAWNRAPQRAIVPYAKSSSLVQTFLSRSAHVKRGLNLGGPPSKAKYSLVTDSGLVP
jgi:hypothetical protein